MLKKNETDWAPKWARPAQGLQAGRPGVLGPTGLALFGVHLISVFFSTKYASTLIYVLPKPPTISAYKYPEAAVKERGSERIAEGQQKRSRGSREAHPEIHSS